MPEVKTHVFVDHPVEEVFNFLAASLLKAVPTRNDHTTLLVEQLTEGEVGKGTRFRLISAKSGVEPDPSISELLKGIDLDTLDPDLRKELTETFMEITAFEKNKLLELMALSGDGKALERFSFKKEKGGTRIDIAFRFELAVKGHKIISFFANRLMQYMMKKSGVAEIEQEFKELIESGLGEQNPVETTAKEEN